jgi:hypothetical protein
VHTCEDAEEAENKDDEAEDKSREGERSQFDDVIMRLLR